MTVADSPAKKAAPTWSIVLGVVLLGAFIVALVAANNAPASTERDIAANAIAECWKQQQRKSLDPATQRFIAGTCEHMESEFREKYHAEP